MSKPVFLSSFHKCALCSHKRLVFGVFSPSLFLYWSCFSRQFVDLNLEDNWINSQRIVILNLILGVIKVARRNVIVVTLIWLLILMYSWAIFVPIPRTGSLFIIKALGSSPVMSLKETSLVIFSISAGPLVCISHSHYRFGRIKFWWFIDFLRLLFPLKICYLSDFLRHDVPGGFKGFDGS